MGNWRTWHMMERPDGTVSLYYTRPDDPAQYVIYDTLNTPTPSLLARVEGAEDEVKRLRAHVAQLETELAMTTNALRVTQDSVLRSIDRADVFKADADQLREYLNGRRDIEGELAAENTTLRAQVATLTICDCGRPLSVGQCGICDNDE